MQKRLSILLILLLITLNIFACLNGDSKELKNGTILYMDYDSQVPIGHSFYTRDNFKSAIEEMDSLYLATKDLDYLSDKGILLILTKEYSKAIQLYLKIEKLKPHRYSTASNIGTAYELIGDNKNALIWIKKAIEINSKSHYESEWLHVKILEAKINGESSINSLFLLNTDFGNDSVPNSNLSGEELHKLNRAIFYQLNERISFIKPKEKIVAQLLFDLGNTEYLLGNHSGAILAFKKAKEYGFNIHEVEKRLKAPKKPNHSIELRNKKVPSITADPINYLFYFGIAFSIVLIIIIIVIIRKRESRLLCKRLS